MSDRVKEKYASYDVVVVGGGLSGMCAAIAAARHGAKTALIQGRHVFGGNASGEIRMHICGASESMAKPDLEEGGILYEMMLENKSRNDYYNFSIWDMVLFSAVKKEKKFLWKTPDVSELPIVCDYLGDEAFALCGNNQEGYIVRGNTGEVFYGRTEKTRTIFRENNGKNRKNTEGKENSFC